MVSQEYPVTCAAGDEANGTASIMKALLEQNFENKPYMIKVAKRMRRPVAIISTDTETEVTIDFSQHGAVVYNGLVGEPNVALHVDSDQLLELSKLRIRAGGFLPIGLASPLGIRIVRQVIGRKMVIKGLLSHTIASMRTLALVSLAD
ncbi:MAG: hypothetical protein ACT4P1_11600 [Sporichthyaceae bacterium]